MAPRLADRVAQYTPTTGTGTLTLGTAVPGHRTFLTAMGAGDVFYGIVDEATGAWEVGWGTLAADESLTRTEVFSSSAGGGAKVDFGPGNKIVYNTMPARQYVFTLDMGEF